MNDQFYSITCCGAEDAPLRGSAPDTAGRESGSCYSAAAALPVPQN